MNSMDILKRGRASGLCLAVALAATLPAAIPATPARAAERAWTNSTGMDFVLIDAGSFQMGCVPGESCRQNEQPRHEVRISKPFYLGIYEVTQAQWEAVMGAAANPSKHKGANNPVDNVSRDDALAFIAALNRKEGHQRYRLPTEAEWEYAARAGSANAHGGGQGHSHSGKGHAHGAGGDLGDLAWFGADVGSGSRPVGQKKPNAWGLYDMQGNVWEWVQDAYDTNYYAASPKSDPRGPAAGGTFRAGVVRGCCWYNDASICRLAYRNNYAGDIRHESNGFRLALSVE